MANEMYEIQVERGYPGARYWSKAYTASREAEVWEKYKDYKSETARVVKITREVLEEPLVGAEITLKFKVRKIEKGLYGLDSSMGTLYATEEECRKLVTEGETE